MIIQHPDPPLKHIAEYEFQFTNGGSVGLSLDLDAGDTINFFDDRIEIHVCGAPHLEDPTKHLPDRDITLYRQHVISVQKLINVIQPLPEIASADWLENLKLSSKTIQ